ncbi:VWA domain-containing protein [Patescibacteria group bacterium]|nr:VWA domain-containing protein [Patescibacteria group bacterium]
MDQLVVGAPTISVYIMDRSGSMESYAPTPKTALNQALLTLKESPVAERMAAMIVSFADHCTFDVPLQPVSRVQLLETYNPEGGTALYDTLSAIMNPLIAACHDCSRRRQGVNIILSIFTDGEDNKSASHSLDEVRALARHADSYGWQLYTNGFGVDAASIAARMGFPSDRNHATSYYGRPQAQAANITRSVHAATHTTIVSAYGHASPANDIAPASTPR